MSITWTIQQLDRLTSDGFVTTAHWRATAVDGEYIATIYGTCGWPTAAPTIPYDQLTQDVVLEWVWSDGVNKTETEASLAAQIELQKNPVVEAGIPW
jgi:hypothetical protein